MAATGGLGVLAIATVLLSVALLAYPAWWMRSLARSGMSRSELSLVQLPIVTTAMATLAIIPASLADVGWAVVPGLVILIALDYVLAHSAVVRMHERQGRVERLSTFLGFLAPQALVTLSVLGVALWETFVAQKLEEMSSAMSEVALVSVLFLGMLPPSLASIAITVCFARHRRVMSPRGAEE